MTARLERALIRSAMADGVALTITRSIATDWCSATFVGERHTITAVAEQTPALSGWLSRLDRIEWAIPNMLVADMLVVAHRAEGDRATATIEALTLDPAG